MKGDLMRICGRDFDADFVIGRHAYGQGRLRHDSLCRTSMRKTLEGQENVVRPSIKRGLKVGGRDELSPSAALILCRFVCESFSAGLM